MENFKFCIEVWKNCYSSCHELKNNQMIFFLSFLFFFFFLAGANILDADGNKVGR